MKDTDDIGLFAIWLAPETRWITAWDFMRRNEYGIEDAILVFHNALAADEARRRLSPVLAPACDIVQIFTPATPHGKD